MNFTSTELSRLHIMLEELASREDPPTGTAVHGGRVFLSGYRQATETSSYCAMCEADLPEHTDQCLWKFLRQNRGER